MSCLLIHPAWPDESGKKPQARQNAFFGLHFDLHPSKTDTELGADVSTENIARLLNRVKPDYIQYDCKGHVGWAGYPTKIGWPAPGIKKDSLAVWRKVTREQGVALFIHYSGVWDSQAIEHHPEWARIDEKGNRDPNNTSVFGVYKDEFLIPQLKEVTSVYELDGVWVDGECWAAQLDYSPRALDAWKKETGLRTAPKDRNDPRWLDWKMFNRRAFENYLCHWVDALHAFNPNLQITSNWMYTSFAPKPLVAKLDFLSGDYSPSLSLDRARVEARYLASTGMPWDLMAWGFDKGKDQGWSIKTPVQLMQEAAVVLMQGGGFQIYHQPTRSGLIVDAIIDQEGQVADFCRARQEVSFKSKTVPQIALLLSSESHWDKSEKIFAPWGGEFDDLEGTLHALLELHYSVDILAEHQLEPRLKDFALVVIPDSHKLADGFKKSLMGYVERGGNLLLLGEKCARLFEPALGVSLAAPPQNITAELATSSGPVSVNGIWQDITLSSARPAGFRHLTRDTGKGPSVAATLTDFGKGKIGAVYGPLAGIFFKSHHPYLRKFIGDIVKELFPEPAVFVDGPATVDIALRTTKSGRLSLHLLNRSNLPLPDRYNFTDFIPAVGPLTVKIKTAKKPQKVTLAPEGPSLQWDWKSGLLSAVVPRIHVHSVIVVE
ncbi:MAG: hypothetical protein NTV82_12955 [Candidatus Aminicenantes bacterium]|nr:hypothetical protein [Candidatus Aminicenantes bacterium]